MTLARPHIRSDRSLWPVYRAQPDQGTVVEVGGTVTAGVPGRVTFTLPASGHNDITQGVYVIERAVDVLGRVLAPLPADTDATTLSQVVSGLLTVQEVNPPTLGNGVQVVAGVGIGATAADVFAVSSSDGISFGGGYDFASTRAVYPWRWAAGWTTLSTSAHADIREMAVEGTWGPGPAQPHGIGVGGNHLTTRGNGLLATLLAAHAGLDWWIIYGAFRSGVSSGSESVTVDITSDLLQRVR